MSALRLSILAFIAVMPRATAAQATVDAPKPRFTLGSSQTTTGYVRLDDPELDARFAAAGLPGVAHGAVTVGFGADVRRGRVLFGGGYQSLLARHNRSDAYRTRTSGSYTLLDVGYAAVRTARLSVYPLAGFGATHLALSVKSRGDFTFDQGLQAPARELTMSGTAAVAHGGMLVERRFTRGESEFAVSLRAGVIRTVGTQSWLSDDDEVSDGPSKVRGSYVRLAFSKPLRSRRDAVLPIAGAAAQAVLR